jgi:hypothetical protein
MAAFFETVRAMIFTMVKAACLMHSIYAYTYVEVLEKCITR